MPPRSKRLSGNARPGESPQIIRNVTVLGQRTSVRLEPEMWDALLDVCRREGRSVHEVCSRIAEAKPPAASLTAAIRVFLLSYFRRAATEQGHVRAGHGDGRAGVVERAFPGTLLPPAAAPPPA
ncbi:ribbon-helix-helix domain-containing protein [Rhodocista pekingensis]|uniref:Ribbon-helix-helix domain-containing protein n=1 Tax=Rhodocista pekingensis TaxID=201185 RepID=A0ABW2KR48_9PROT